MNCGANMPIQHSRVKKHHSRSHAWALAACLPSQDHVWITIDQLVHLSLMKCFVNWFPLNTYVIRINSNLVSRCSWVWFERTSTFSGIQFTRHFSCFQLFWWKTNQSFGQHLSMAAGSKQQALAFHFPLLITTCFWYQNIEKSSRILFAIRDVPFLSWLLTGRKKNLLIVVS